MRHRRLGLLIVLGTFLITLAGAGASVPAPDLGRVTAHLVGHAHIDLSWLWRWEETVHDIAVATFRGTLEMMDKVKGLTFAQSQPAVYEAVERNYPDLFAGIRAKVKAGTWVPVGGMWCEPDLNMPDGEALARQLLYGQRYFREKFGVQASVGWNPDSFGHSAQLPQLLRQAGIDAYVFGRCAPANTTLFWWEGLDGSRVLGYVPPGWYNLSLENGVAEPIAQAVKNNPVKDFLLLYGAGDHGGGPRQSDLAAYERFRRAKGHPRLEFGTPGDYFDKVLAQHLDFPVVKGELNYTFPACYTTQAATKRNNRRSESLLLTAEKFGALATFAGFRDYYPERDLDEAWKVVLRNQFHDMLDGSGIGPVYADMAAYYAEAQERGRRALDFSLETISDAVDTRGEGWPVIVYNPLVWDRTDEVEMTVNLPGSVAAAGFSLKDPEGQDVPVQVLGTTPAAGETADVRLLFVARGVPSLGYRVFHIIPEASRPEAGPSLAVTATSLENEFFRVTLDPVTGWIRGIFDKRAGREVLSGPGNVLQAIADEPASMSAWELGLKDTLARIGETGSRVEVLEQGPVRAAIRVKSLFRRSSFVQDIRLYRGLPRIDCQLGFDWQERRVMIKAAFPAAVRNGEAWFEIPFGAVSRPSDGTEVPALRWIDLTDASGRSGLSLLNDGKYGFDVKDGTLRLSVVHGATSPDPEADRGPGACLYSLFPHDGSWQEAGTARRGYELNVPLEARSVMVHEGSWPASASFLRCDAEGVIVSTLKKESGYEGRDLVLRAYETFGRKARVTLDMPWKVDAREANVLEDLSARTVSSGGKITFDLGPHEIKTLRITRQKAAS